MRCKEAELWISSRIDGEAIPATALEALEGHLAGCDACSSFLRAGEEGARALGAYLAAGDPEPLARAVMARVRAGEDRFDPAPWLARKPAGRWAPYRRPLAVAAAALLVLGALVFLGPGPGSDDARRAGSEAPGGPGTRLIYIDERMAPQADGSPFDKQIFEKRQIILEPSKDSSWKGPPPADIERRRLLQTQFQRLVDYRYY